MKLRIHGTGTPSGTDVVDDESGDLIEGAEFVGYENGRVVIRLTQYELDLSR